jgi:adhesin transport system outer membrane protein
MTKILPPVIGSAIFAFGLALSPAVLAENLKEVVQQTISTNPEIQVFINDRLARDQEVRQARSGYYPEINLNAGIGYEWTDNPTTSPDDEELTRKEASLELRQMLFDGFATRSEVQRQQARVNSAAHKISEIAEKTALRTIEVYLELIKQNQLLSLAEENLKAHQRIFDQIERRSESGVSRKADFDQISGRLALAESNTVASKNNVMEAEANYIRVVGQKPVKLEQSSIAQGMIPANVEDAVATAIGNHPTLQSALSDVDAAMAQHEAAKHAYYPRFDFELGRTWNEDIDGVKGNNEDLTAMIRMRWNLFRGKHDEARREETALLINEAKEIRNNAIRQAEEGVRLSWASYQSTKAQLAFLEKHMAASKQTRKAYAKQFDIGQRSLLDLLDTENEVFESSKAFLTAEYTNQFAQYRILAGMGKLLDSLEVGSPAESMPLAQTE